MSFIRTSTPIFQKTVTSARKQNLQSFQHQLRIKFKNLNLLDLALTHSSYSNEVDCPLFNNERLEFLGDSVLGVVICDYLYSHFPNEKEGVLARIKSSVVSEDTLSAIAFTLQIDKYLVMGKGEELSGGRKKKAILADAMEALIGAYYLDSGFKAVKEYLFSLFEAEIIKVRENRHHRDYKTLLQERIQKEFHQCPRYLFIKKSGPDHNRVYYMSVEVRGKKFGPASGSNKKEAEQAVAKIAYHSLFPSKENLDPS